MPIPQFQDFLLPLLRLLSDGREHRAHVLRELLAKDFSLNEADLKELLPSGKQTVFANRLGWAGTYMKKAGLVEKSRRGFMAITPRGAQVLQEKHSRIDVQLLNRYPEFSAWRAGTEGKRDVDAIHQEDTQTPQETLEQAYMRLRRGVADELLVRIKECSPAFFERLVVELLVKMGYGGSLRDAGRAVGGAGDGGIDGTIKEDKLGLDIIYIQAKRWEGVVGRPEIQKFAGALQGHRAKKGVLITTSSFTREAQDFVNIIDSKIVLISGEQLTDLMIDHDLGVSREGVFEVKKVDSDYFTDE